MSFLHGISVSPRYHELSPLDRAINAFANKATHYFDQLNEAENAPRDVHEKREQQLQEAKAHQEHERRLLETIADTAK